MVQQAREDKDPPRFRNRLLSTITTPCRVLSALMVHPLRTPLHLTQGLEGQALTVRTRFQHPLQALQA
jgi:hypothetical protein